MKKHYINPTIKVIEITMNQAILTASVGFGDPLSGDNAAAPVFESDTEFFGDDEVNFFE